ncbi:PH domain-like protein [Piromyces finnis]|uniref:PH domain-like protein n=1 Tax=Piromyces finnis TaxID=1754191 RepID=A0A1Y1VHN9_9FUNG|nr:PH domain-like protein [Piromyces finnis]|eukprot:ORX56549.1 PH domain-like protein [Piromyces finnis]
MKPVAGEKRERESEDDSKKNESETEVKDKVVESKNETTEKKEEESKEKKEDKKEDKDEKEPETKKQKVDKEDKADEKTTSSSPKKSVFGSSSSNVSFASFASYKSPFGSLSTEKSSFSSFGKSTNNNTSFESLLSEGKPFDKKKEEKTDDKNSQFKEQTDTKTGEEDEECIHFVRAKLYEDENNSWKERGIGMLKINRNKEDNSKVRLVMRSEGILRVILNERILPGMKFNVIQEKYISFAAIADSKTIKKYLIKAGTAMSANELCQALIKAIPKK